MHKTEDANYDQENNDSRNVLSQCRVKLCDFSIQIISHCSMHRDCLAVKMFFKQVFFNKHPECRNMQLESVYGI